MARPLRVNIPDGWYHCMHRGIERREIFTDTREHQYFLSLLGETVERYRFRVHAYCLMQSHYHAMIQTPDANLSDGMQWLGLSYSSWYNARHDRVGPLFQGRFKSVPVEAGSWAYELSLYVHLNPVRTVAYGLDKRTRKAESQGLTRPPSKEEVTARLQKIRTYPWSSYRTYAGYEAGPAWLSSRELLRRGSDRAEDRHKRYRERMQQVLSRGVDETRLERFREVAGIGSARFIERIKRLADGSARETERRGRLRERVGFEQVVKLLEKQRGEPRGDWLHRHGDWGKWMVLSLARQYSGLTLAELGEQMGNMDYAAVSVGLRRFGERLKRERRLRADYATAKKMLNV